MLALLTWVTLAFGAPEMIPEDDTPRLGSTAPDFEAPLLKGGSFSLASQRGTPVVLAFWASWCGPCRLELPALDVFQADNPQVRVYTVNVDKEQSAAERFLRQIPIQLPVIWDNQAVALGRFDVASMPTVFLVDGNGTIKLEKIGYGKDTGLQDLQAALDGLGR